MNNKKWFYAAREEAANQLQERYEFCSCQFQQITDDRVIEMWRVQHDDNEKPETVFVTITKSGGNHAQLMMWKAEFMKGQPIQITS